MSGIKSQSLKKLLNLSQVCSVIYEESRDCRYSQGMHIPVTREILADPLLIVPEQSVEGQYIAVTDKRQTMID